MPQRNHAIISFNAGEVSPKADARSDVEKYSSGCRILENMLPLIYGCAVRRPGTKYIGTVSDTSVVARLIDFEYSNAIAYIVELGDQTARFYYDGGTLQDAGSDVTISTPYLAADLFELQFKQSNDVMWIVHSSYAPRKLSRTSAVAFSLDEIQFDDGPFLNRNDLDVADDVSLTCSVTAKDAAGTLTATGPMNPVEVFQSGHVGALFQLTQPRAVTQTKGSATGTGVIGDEVDVEGTFSFNTSGNWDGTVTLQRNENLAGWENFRAYTSVVTGGVGSRNIQYTGNETVDDVQYRINVTEYNSGTINADLTINSSTQDGIVGRNCTSDKL
jgi:hypothetical protein